MERSSSPRNDVEVGISVGPFLYAHGGALGNVSPPGCGRYPYKSSMSVMLASLASLAAIVLLLSVCRDFNSKAVVRDIAKRRLSDNGDSSGSELRRMCEKMEDESDSSSSPKPQEERFQGGPAEPAAKLRRVEEVDAEEASTSQAMSVNQLHSEAEVSASSSSEQSTPRASALEFGVVPVPYSFAMPLLALEQAYASFFVPGASSSWASESGIQARPHASADMSLVQSGALQSATAEHLVPSGHRQPEHHHKSAFVDYRDTVYVAQGATLERPDSAPDILEVTNESAVEQDQTVQQLLQSSSSHSGHLDGPQDPDERFYRLPVVQQPGANQLDFEPEIVFPSSKEGRNRIIASYRISSRLLIKSSLSPNDVDVLIRSTEDLALHIAMGQDLGSDISNLKPFTAVVALARRFLALDAVVSALEVLQVPRGAWFEKVAESVSSNYVLSPEPKTHTMQEVFNRQLIQLLSSAIDFLKAGIRPSNSQLATIKRMLFFDDLSPPKIRRSTWNPWRFAA